MTKLLEKAIDKLKQMPVKEQNRFAAMVLEDNLWKENLHLPGKVLTDAQLDELLNEADKNKWTEHKSFMKALDRKIETAKRKVSKAA